MRSPGPWSSPYLYREVGSHRKPGKLEPRKKRAPTPPPFKPAVILRKKEDRHP